MTPSENAIEEIKKLKARYFRCMDSKEWDNLAAVFAPDIAFDLTQVNSVRHPKTGKWEPPYAGPEQIYRGVDTVMTMIRSGLGELYSVHHGHMPEIDILSDTTARGIWAMEDTIWDLDHKIVLHGHGHYHETYERLARGWVIKTMRITRLYTEGFVKEDLT